MTVNRTVMGDDAVAEGTPFRRIRMDDDLWERLEESCKSMDPDDNRSALLRRFARWHVGDIDEMPRRPEPKTGKGPVALRSPYVTPETLRTSEPPQTKPPYNPVSGKSSGTGGAP